MQAAKVASHMCMGRRGMSPHRFPQHRSTPHSTAPAAPPGNAAAAATTPPRAVAAGTPWFERETAIRLSDVPRVLPSRPDGKRVSVDAVYRWSLRGLHGLRLRRFRVGGAWCTTMEELTRWSAALTATTETTL
jgi:hypothetical protein